MLKGGRNPLPQLDNSAIGEEESLTALRSALSHNKFILRDERISDRGVDASLEVVNNFDCTNFRSQIQLKSTTYKTFNNDGSISYPIETTNINYLLNGGINNLYILYIRPTKELRFVWVYDASKKLKKNWSTKEKIKLRFTDILTPENLEKIHARIFSEGQKHRQKLENIDSTQIQLSLNSSFIDQPDTLNNQTIHINWRECFQKRLDSQRELTSNSLMFNDGINKNFADIFVPLGLIETIQRSSPTEKSPEEGSKLYQPTEDKVVKTYNQDDFFEEILRREQSKSRGKRLAIVGEPGAGKTTLLQRIGEWILNNTSVLPIFISFSNLQNKTLVDYLFDDLLKVLLEKRTISEDIKENFEKLFDSNPPLLLLDGIDEIGGNPATILTNIKEQITGLLRKTKIILTCRTNVWEASKNSLTEFDTFRSLDFSYGDSIYPDQVKQFIDKWFVGNEDSANQLRQSLDKPGKERIKDMVKNPLRLVLLCRSWGLRQILPDTKALLYKGFIEAIYAWKSDIINIGDDQKDKLTLFLEHLAQSALNEDHYRFRLKSTFIKHQIRRLKEKQIDVQEAFTLAETIGFLNKIGVAEDNPQETIYAFLHPTFQEYFAAQSINNWQYFFNHIPDNISKGTYHIFDRKWKEVILLWLGREDIGVQTKELFLQALMKFEDNCGDGYKARAILLATIGITEFKSFSESDHLICKVIAWRTKLYNWSEFFTKLTNNALVETNRIQTINALIKEIKDDLDKSDITNKIFLLKQLTSDVFVITWLNKLLESNNNESVNYSIAMIVYNLDTQNQKAISTLEQLCDSENEERRCKCATRLLRPYSGYIPNSEKPINTLLYLLRSSQDQYIIEQSIYYLKCVNGKLLSDIIDTFIYVLHNNPSNNRINSRIIFSLEFIMDNNKQIYHQQIITALEGVLTVNSSWDVVFQIVSLLKKIGYNNRTLIDRLKKLLDSYKQNSRQYIEITQYLLLLDSNNNSAINILVELLPNIQNENIRRNISNCLSCTIKENSFVVEALIGLRNKYPLDSTYKLIAGILVNAGKTDSRVIEIWHTILAASKYEETIISIAIQLIKVFPNDNHTINALLEIIANAALKTEVRREAIQILDDSDFSDDKFVTLLTGLLQDSQEEVCCYAAKVLAKIEKANKAPINRLIQLLQSSDKQLIVQVINVFNELKIENENVIYALINLIKKVAEEIPIEIGKKEQLINVLKQGASILRVLIKDINKFDSELVALLKMDLYEDIHPIISATLKDHLSRIALPLLIKGIQPCIKNVLVGEFNEIHQSCYEMYWHCVQNMPYPEFYEAWHKHSS